MTVCATYRVAIDSEDPFNDFYGILQKEHVPDADLDGGFPVTDYRKIGDSGTLTGQNDCVVTGAEVK